MIDRIIKEFKARAAICKRIYNRDSDIYYQGKMVAYGEAVVYLQLLTKEEQEKVAKEAFKNVPTITNYNFFSNLSDEDRRELCARLNAFKREIDTKSEVR